MAERLRKQKYTFTGFQGGETTVMAFSEAEARHLAMVERWGPPTGIWGSTWNPPKGVENPHYKGEGLSLKVETGT
jgi:hypothetical protein